MTSEDIKPEPSLGVEFEKCPTNVQVFKTAQGSKYAYFDNGKTQRYKTVDNEYREPSDILVFVPDYTWFSKNAPADLRARFPDEKSYDTNLILLAQGRDASAKIVDKHGNVLNSNTELQTAGVVYLAFILPKKDGSKGVFFHIPVAKSPKVGFSTFDVRYSEHGSSRHLGNKVTEIIEGPPLPASQIMPARKRDPNEIS